MVEIKNDTNELIEVRVTGLHDIDYSVDAPGGWGHCRKCGAMFHDDAPCAPPATANEEE